MLNLGIIGFSEGNGHPYSFSAIINGYNSENFKLAGWDNILMYLEAQDKSELGFNDCQVTHVWCQDIEESVKIAKATNIENVVTNYIEMLGNIDALIIARDDSESHYIIAKPFLEIGIPVFIDKPLTLNEKELDFFNPYLISNKLMSCSGIHFAPELDLLKRDIDDFGTMKLIQGTIVKNWDKYAIHMLQGIFSVVPFNVESINYIPSNHDSYIIKNRDGSLIEINALGQSALTLRLEFYSEKNYYLANTLNSFVAFKRTLKHFIAMVKNGESAVPAELTINLMKLLMAGKKSKNLGMEIKLI